MMIDNDNELNKFIQDNELGEFIQDDEIDERPFPDSDESIIALMDDNEIMEEIIKQLTKERDEARREVCDWINTDESGCVKSGSVETAIERGWDCFKKEETP